MLSPSRIAIIVTALLMTCPTLLVGGCDSAQPTGSLADGVRNYEAQRYMLARQQARDALSRSRGPQRDEAAYLAGISAYQLGDTDDARRHLRLAARSSEAGIAGRAAAQLGLLDLDADHPLNAAMHFETAADKLDGVESRRAAQHAALAYQLAGDYDTAQQWMNRGSKGGPTVVAADRPPRSRGGSRYVLQHGAFRSRDRAEQVASELEALSNRHHLGPVQIVPQRDGRGMTLHLVQFGGFTSRAEAARARARLGKLEFIVVPASRSTSAGY